MTTGIYMIISKREPRMFYIGSAVNIELRLMIHRHKVTNQTHENLRIRNYFNKYGVDDMLFVIAKICDRNDLLKYEQELMDAMQPTFNICSTAGNRMGTTHSPATKITLSNKLKHIRKPTRYESIRGHFVKQGS